MLNNYNLQNQQRLVVRPIMQSDLKPLMATVGRVVGSLYPEGDKKLFDRLESACQGLAVSHVVALHDRIPSALSSETSKGAAGIKLSTFWVDPRFRGLGIGSRLLDFRISDWIICGKEQSIVTVREERAVELERLFLPRGFMRIATVNDRYGDGRNEVVLRWRSQQFMNAYACHLVA